MAVREHLFIFIFKFLNILCPEWNCKTTDNRSMLATASAVIFNYVDTNVERRPGQYFVFYSQVL